MRVIKYEYRVFSSAVVIKFIDVEDLNENSFFI